MGKNRKPRNAASDPNPNADASNSGLSQNGASETPASMEQSQVSSDPVAEKPEISPAGESLAANAGLAGSIPPSENDASTTGTDPSEAGQEIETITYPDGVTATGTAPLPDDSPETPEGGDAGETTTLSITGDNPQPDPASDPQTGDQGAQASEDQAEPETSVEQLEQPALVVDDGYTPLMSIENIAQAANESAFAVAIQAGSRGGFEDDSPVARLCVDFLDRWPEAPVSAMIIHACRSTKSPMFDFHDMPPAAQVSIRVFRLVALECLAEERVNRARYDIEQAKKLLDVPPQGVDREDLAMTPADDSQLSELGRAAARG